MKNIKILAVICGLLLYLRCQPQTNSKDDAMITKSMNEPNKTEADLKQRVLTGNIEAYEQLSTAYLDHAPGEFLIWALIMANKHDYPQAYFDVFLQLSELGDESFSLDHLDDRTKSMALEYLTKAVEHGHHQAPEVLGQYFMEGKYVKQDTMRGRQLINKANQERK